jgi:hypothetical protein
MVPDKILSILLNFNLGNKILVYGEFPLKNVKIISIDEAKDCCQFDSAVSLMYIHTAKNPIKIISKMLSLSKGIVFIADWKPSYLTDLKDVLEYSMKKVIFYTVRNMGFELFEGNCWYAVVKNPS